MANSPEEIEHAWDEIEHALDEIERAFEDDSKNLEEIDEKFEALLRKHEKALTPWDNFIELARKGDGEKLAVVLREHAKEIDWAPPEVLFFLADILDGTEPLARRKKRTARFIREQYFREFLVLSLVRREMNGRRDTATRRRLIDKYAARYSTTREAVEAFAALPKDRSPLIPT
jgi:hypothetical protein